MLGRDQKLKVRFSIVNARASRPWSVHRPQITVSAVALQFVYTSVDAIAGREANWLAHAAR